MEVFRVHQATATMHAEQFGTGRIPVNHDEGGDFIALQDQWGSGIRSGWWLLQS